jgi:succinyl-diaminopimelate desuccinylase
MSDPSLAVELTQHLIRCPSITPVNAGALEVVERALASVGFEIHRLTFSQADTPDVENLFAKIGNGDPHLVFAGHTDVVPTGDIKRWRYAPFSGEVAENKIYGRGASDMKGAIAAFTAATIKHIRRHGKPKGSLSFLITGDEEGPSLNGTIKLLDWARARGERFSHCIVGEPTNVSKLGDTIKIGRRGSVNGLIRVIGKQGHVAYPHRAENPAPVIARIVTALSHHEFDQGTAHFDRTNLEFSSIDIGNAAVNVIPATASAQFNVRFNDSWTLDSLKERVRAVVATAAGSTTVELDFLPSNAVSFLTAPGVFSELVSTSIKAVTGLTPELSTSGGTSDARFIIRDCPTLEFGLTNETIHAVDECASISDIEALEQIYSLILTNYFKT